MSGRFLFGRNLLQWSDPLPTKKFWSYLLLIIDDVLNTYLALCQSNLHCRSLLVPANFDNCKRRGRYPEVYQP